MLLAGRLFPTLPRTSASLVHCGQSRSSRLSQSGRRSEGGSRAAGRGRRGGAAPPLQPPQGGDDCATQPPSSTHGASSPVGLNGGSSSTSSSASATSSTSTAAVAMPEATQARPPPGSSAHAVMASINETTKWAVSTATFAVLLWQRDAGVAWCVVGSVAAAMLCRVRPQRAVPGQGPVAGMRWRNVLAELRWI